ncbi:chemotaxis protein CheW [Herbaspirillum sp. RTI4]|uniref:chemotaxis protein CheW n=1 Tax=Herbaspirillum sp. RTI4 TaxID=3048640 RepID=UPI002AB38156|nr:chemotaxis protein CheW [Herbaspirillum sp. RTI4]MDY7579523.1 chemotaxis protein CheW [Herbaspirillum sp. RTI4]MEA9983151.1 chemotaxis protein CheW [Herbaspirillum sp. RTI4]
MEASRNLYFVFSMRNSLYAIDSVFVNMTFSLPAIEHIESAPAYVAGVINLRGSIMPVLDLSLLLGGRGQERHLSDAVLVIQEGHEMVGMIVNEVLDVIHIEAAQIDLPPKWEDTQHRQSSLIVGMARVDEQIISILDHRLLIAHRDDLIVEEGLSGNVVQAAEPLSSADHDILQKRAAELIRKTEADAGKEIQQFAVVLLGHEYFGMDIRYVNEFTKIKNIIPLPNCPSHVLGNMNLRGNILTVIDIRTVLGMPVDNFNLSAKIVVGSTDNILVGVAVDDIDDIVQVDPTEVVPLPTSAHQDVLRYFVGTIHYNDKAMTILNLPEILRSKELIVSERS